MPYDVDHILPAAHLNMRGRSYGWPDLFWKYRAAILHSSGNKRIWPKSLNRADGQNTLQAKHILGPGNGLTDGNPNLAQYGLKCVEDIRRASIISQDGLDDWEQAANSNDVYNWSDPERLLAFRRAVDTRRSAIYQNFFDRLGFEEWLAL